MGTEESLIDCNHELRREVTNDLKLAAVRCKGMCSNYSYELNVMIVTQLSKIHFWEKFKPLKKC